MAAILVFYADVFLLICFVTDVFKSFKLGRTDQVIVYIFKLEFKPAFPKGLKNILNHFPGRFYLADIVIAYCINFLPIQIIYRFESLSIDQCRFVGSAFSFSQDFNP